VHGCTRKQNRGEIIALDIPFPENRPEKITIHHATSVRIGCHPVTPNSPQEKTKSLAAAGRGLHSIRKRRLFALMAGKKSLAPSFRENYGSFIDRGLSSRKSIQSVSRTSGRHQANNARHFAARLAVRYFFGESKRYPSISLDTGRRKMQLRV